MKTRFYTFLLIWVTSLLSLSSLYAQIEDFDPGYFFIMKDEGPVAMDEGLEWTITFSCEDTLGVKYNHPVQIHFQGGGNEESSNFSLQDVDSMVMFQPEPILAEGVYEITREHFPFILGVDTTYTIIYFSKEFDEVFTLPEIGTKVVCNHEEQPLPLGFVGIVDAIADFGDYYEVRFNGKWEKLAEFYNFAILTRKLIPVEDALKMAPGPKLSRRQEALRRKGSPRIPKTGVAPSFYDKPGGWSVKFDLPDPGTISFNKEFVDGVKVEGKLGVHSIAAAFDAEISVLVDGEWVHANGVSDFVGCEDWTFAIQFGAVGQIGFDLQLDAEKKVVLWPKTPLPKSVSAFGKSFDLTFGVGLNLKGNLQLNIPTVNLDLVAGWRNGESMYSESRDFFTFGASDAWSLALTASVGIGAFLDIKFKDELAEPDDLPFALDMGLYAAYFWGKVKITGTDYGVDTPADLYNTWTEKSENFRLNIKLGYIPFTLKVSPKYELFRKLYNKIKKIADPSGDNTLFCLYHWDSQYLPTYSYELKPVSSNKENKLYKCHLEYGPGNIMDWDAQVWLFDVKENQFVVKEPVCKGRALLFSVEGDSKNFSLRKGRWYKAIPVFSTIGDYMSNIIPKDFRALYDVETDDIMKGNNGRGLIDQQAIVDANQHTIKITDVGFQVTSSENWENIDKATHQSCFSTWGGGTEFYGHLRNITAEKEYCYRSYIEVCDYDDNNKGTKTLMYGDLSDFVAEKEAEDPKIKILGVSAYTNFADVSTQTDGFIGKEFQIEYRYTDNIDIPVDQWEHWDVQMSQSYGPYDRWLSVQNETLKNLKPGTNYTLQVSIVSDQIPCVSDVTTFKTESAGPQVTPGEWIDLGLPSGTLWASCNFGASEPQQYGNYYAWGELSTKDHYSKDNYDTGDVDADNNPVYWIEDLDDMHDVTVVETGGVSKMPTREELTELFSMCSWEMVKYKGVSGLLLTGTNNNTIFIPANGFFQNSKITDKGELITLWTRTFESTLTSYALSVYIDTPKEDYEGVYVDYYSSYIGMCIRPIKYNK